MLYCNTVTVVATPRAGAGLGAQALGWACRRWAGAQAGAGCRHGRWGVREARGQAGKRAGARRASVLGRAGRACRGAQGARHERQARGRASGDTAMLAYDTAEGLVATRPRLLRHGASACNARGYARPRRGLGAGWVCWLGQLGQVGAPCTWLSSNSVFGPGSTRYFPESLNEHCSLQNNF